MKKAIILIVMTIAATFTVAAQSESIITEDEYDAAIEAAWDKDDGLKRKVVWIIETFDHAILKKTETTIDESIPPDYSRYETTVKRGDSVTRKVEVFYKGRGYVSVNGGRWRKMPRPEIQSVSLSQLPPGERIEETKTYRMIESETVPVKIYRYERVRTLYRKGGSENGESEFYFEEYSMNDQGLIVRSTERTSKLTPENVTKSIVRTVEYNPGDIKINIPAIARSRRKR